MYLNKKLDVHKGVFEGCNQVEIAELIKRRNLEDWLINSKYLRE
jgi:hypothetical protein